MLENVHVYIITYVFVLIVQGYISFLKNSIWGMLPIIISSMVFIITANRDIFTLLVIQVAVFSIIRFTKYILSSFILKSRNTKIDKTRIHDL